MPVSHLRAIAALAVTAALAATLAVAAPVRGGDDPETPSSPAWRGLFGERAHTSFPERAIVVLAAPSVSDRATAARRAPTARQERRWAADAEAAQRLLIGALRNRGVAIVRTFTYTRVLNGFSAKLNARAVAELERAPGVVGVYPVRAVYPASTAAVALARPEFAEGQGRRPEVTLPGSDGSGVTVALLDTGVDLDHGYLHGRVEPGFDLVDRDGFAAAEPKPDEPAILEAHGTRMAGILVGRDGPAGLRGAAPGVTVLPIRILGWRQTDSGYALLGRGDELIAGIERAVDPDRDGDTEDAAHVALAAVVEPYAAFADSPEARAVAGAARLGTLVVAPAGNEGPAGPGFGSIGAPGGAPAALTVGALDMRRQVPAARAVVRVGLDTVFDGPVRVLGPTPVDQPLSVGIAAPLGPTLGDTGRAPAALASGDSLADLFDAGGVSLVAGRAALLPADGRSLAVKARHAAAAGAVALLVFGTPLPAGGLDLDAAAVPVVAIPTLAGRAAIEALADGGSVSVSLAQGRLAANQTLRTVAAFSSHGLAFDGRVKPDLVAPGVGIATADPGRSLNGAERYATVTGSSAAAAVAAGAAALVADARPELTAEELKNVLVGSARQVIRGGRAEPVTAQGAGLVDPGAAAAARIAVQPATLALGRAGGASWETVRAVTIRNLSKRRLTVELGFVRDPGSDDAVGFKAQPVRLRLKPGASGKVALVATASRAVRSLASGALVVRAGGAPPARVPWAVAPRGAGDTSLVGDLRLSHDRFEPSAAAPVVLAFRAGSIEPGAEGQGVEPVGLLDLELWTSSGKRLGVLARLRDLLPGRYAFGLTGRDADGRKLAPGRYTVRLRARAVDAGDGASASTAEASFVIESAGAAQ